MCMSLSGIRPQTHGSYPFWKSILKATHSLDPSFVAIDLSPHLGRHARMGKDQEGFTRQPLQDALCHILRLQHPVDAAKTPPFSVPAVVFVATACGHKTETRIPWRP